MKQISTNTIFRAVGAAMLAVSLWMNWWEAGFDDVTAWSALELLDIVLAAIALAVLASIASRFHVSVPDRLAQIDALPLGITAVVLIFVTMLNDPPAVAGANLAFGIWFAMVGSVLITVGALLSEKQISITFADKEADAATATPPDAEAPAEAAETTASKPTSSEGADAADETAVTKIQPAGATPGSEAPSAGKSSGE